MTLHAENTMMPVNSRDAPNSNVAVIASAGELTRTSPLKLTVQPILKGTLPVNLATNYNLTGIHPRGAKFPLEHGLDGEAAAFSEALLRHEQIGGGADAELQRLGWLQRISRGDKGSSHAVVA